jgi:hypothetical protein
MYCSSHLFPIHIIYALIFPNTNQSDSQIANINISTICTIYMSFEAVLGNKEFELVVFGVTFALSNSSEGGPVLIFKCGSRKEKYLASVTI